jgi:predicted Zn-dependent protease
MLALARRFAAVAPACTAWTARASASESRSIALQQGVLEPVSSSRERGVQVAVRVGDGEGWAATADCSDAGLRAVGERARNWALVAAGRSLVAASALPVPHSGGAWRAPVQRRWEEQPIGDAVEVLRQASAALKCHEHIVAWSAGLRAWTTRSALVSSAGAEVEQERSVLVPVLSATANQGGESQTRSLGMEHALLGGLERVTALDAWSQAGRIADEALALLAAENCPSGPRDLILLPSQMVLQIHESIGHPLELDRILGDERNYAGGSWVTPDLVGQHRYGSDLLTVSFDPGVDGEVASYAFDDDGSAARRELLIERGILKRVLGGAASQARSGVPGVACARACAWNRPPIDRMANLNLEPGTATLASLIAGIADGVLMDTNRSWSIDDRRDKFQFGCEMGRRIRDGRLAGLVRNPNYRGRSATFWRSLDGVGDRDSFRVMGTPNCGKGEPNQMIATGHASPPCRFRQVEIFGGAS